MSIYIHFPFGEISSIISCPRTHARTHKRKIHWQFCRNTLRSLHSLCIWPFLYSFHVLFFLLNVPKVSVVRLLYTSVAVSSSLVYPLNVAVPFTLLFFVSIFIFFFLCLQVVSLSFFVCSAVKVAALLYCPNVGFNFSFVCPFKRSRISFHCSWTHCRFLYLFCLPPRKKVVIFIFKSRQKSCLLFFFTLDKHRAPYFSLQSPLASLHSAISSVLFFFHLPFQLDSLSIFKSVQECELLHLFSVIIHSELTQRVTFSSSAL